MSRGGDTSRGGLLPASLSLRISRQVRDIASVVARMERAADRGFAIMSGFVSAGEQEVRDALCLPLPRGCCLNWLIFV